MKKIYSIEICAGAGGLSLGLEKVGIYPKMLIDIFPAAIETLKANKPNWNVYNKDLLTIMKDKKWLANHLQPHIGIDLLSGGLPCQPFSYSGKKGV